MMRILADENFPGISVQQLQRHGHDVLWVRTDLPGASDSALLTRAQDEQRLLVTLDKDFGELAFRVKLPATYGVVLFRMKMSDPKIVPIRMVKILESRSDWVGHFSVVEDDRIRMRPLTDNNTA